MKAVTFRRYGPPDVLQLEQVARPEPSNDEVLIAVHAVSLNAADWRVMRGKPFPVRFMAGGLRQPRMTILGADVAGRVEAIGTSVRRFQVGDEVFGNLSACGWGGLAEYVCARESALASKPANVTFEQAAAVPMAAGTALQALCNQGGVQEGQKVLINGASGGVGTFAVQIAKAFGAEVTAVCSTRNIELARSLGADHVIDYTKGDIALGERLYDLIIGVNGYRPIAEYKRALRPRGVYVMAGGSGAQMMEAMLLGPWHSLMSSKKLGNLLSQPNLQDLEFISRLLESGKLTPVIAERYQLEEAPKAFRYLEEGHARGKVVFTVADPDQIL